MVEFSFYPCYTIDHGIYFTECRVSSIATQTDFDSTAMSY